MDSFPTQVDNADTSNVSMDMDMHDSRYILSNDNGQSANVHDGNNNDQNSMQSINFDPSSDTIHSTQSESNISNDNNGLNSNSMLPYPNSQLANQKPTLLS